MTDPAALDLGPLSPVAEEAAGTSPTPSAKDPSKRSNEMKEAYRSVKKSYMTNGKLSRQNVLDLIDIIIRRKNIKITVY